MPNKIIPYNPQLRDLARKLRLNSTLSEVLLWKQIKTKRLGVEFHRQQPIDQYIVDFYCHELMLAIEIDGNTHHFKDAEMKDTFRQQRLEKLGVRFIRFSDMIIKADMNCVIWTLTDRIRELREPTSP